MIILLKLACLSIWFIILVAALQAGRLRPVRPTRQVIISLTDSESAEKKTRQALRKLHPDDRLVLQIPAYPQASPALHLIADRLCLSNPSILIFITQPGT
ncbi:MAG TPA: hypothetical protein GX404_08175 [Syntrophomonadaceae bacterium]|nr:hypothetical protein [Syntrophomonadaceae bacterium]